MPSLENASAHGILCLRRDSPQGTRAGGIATQAVIEAYRIQVGWLVVWGFALGSSVVLYAGIIWLQWVLVRDEGTTP